MKPSELMDIQERDPKQWAQHFLDDVKFRAGGRPLRQSEHGFISEWFHHALQCGLLHGGPTGHQSEKTLLEDMFDEIKHLRREVNTLADNNQKALQDLKDQMASFQEVDAEVLEAMTTAVTVVQQMEQQIIDLQKKIDQGASNTDISADVEAIAQQFSNVTPALKAAAEALKTAAAATGGTDTGTGGTGTSAPQS